MDDLIDDTIPEDEFEDEADTSEDEVDEGDEEETDDEGDTSDEDGDEPDEEEDGAEAGDGLPEGVKRRFAKLTKQRKTAEERAAKAEKELEALRERSGETNPKLLMAVAQKHGILPRLLSAKDAKDIDRADKLEGRIDVLEETLEELEDSGENEIVIGGETYTRAQLRKNLRKAKSELADFEDSVKETRKTLAARCRKLIELGLEAEKAAKSGKKKPKPASREDDDPPAKKKAKKRKSLNGLESHEDSGELTRPKSPEEAAAFRRKILSRTIRGE